MRGDRNDEVASDEDYVNWEANPLTGGANTSLAMAKKLKIRMRGKLTKMEMVRHLAMQSPTIETIVTKT